MTLRLVSFCLLYNLLVPIGRGASLARQRSTRQINRKVSTRQKIDWSKGHLAK